MTKNIALFYPYVSKKMRRAADIALGDKMLGQGETVDRFEDRFGQELGLKYPVSVNSGSSALEIAYDLMDFRPGDEVISTVFTQVITNLALLRRRVKIVFADIKENMLLDWDDVEKKISKKTKAIVDVHLFNQLNETRDLGIPVIGDSAQYLAKTKGERLTIYSFQATKLMTTVDGGMLVCRNRADYQKAKLLRWYGIDRETRAGNITDVDITEIGYKYHMNNVTASLGLAALDDLAMIRKKVDQFGDRYRKGLAGIDGLTVVGGAPFLVHARDRKMLIKKLAERGIQTGLTMVRNDQYSVFGGTRQELPGMNRVESTYLLLPCRGNLEFDDIDFICDQIRKILK